MLSKLMISTLNFSHPHLNAEHEEVKIVEEEILYGIE